MRAIWRNKLTWIVLLVLPAIGGTSWTLRKPILAWYYVRQLSSAYDENRDLWAKHVAAQEEAALPYLWDGLHNGDAIVCTNMQIALELIARKWGSADPRCRALVESLQKQFGEFSPAGQEKALLFLTAFMQQDGPRPWPPTVTTTIGELLLSSEKKDPALRGVGLLLAAELVDCVQPGQWAEPCAELAERGLGDKVASTRLAAVRLLLREPMRKNKDVLAKVVPLLHDPDASVRRVAVLALASEIEIIREDALMGLLHDDDPEVQYLCELALRKRGLTDDDMQIARMIADRDPKVRMRVLYHLPNMPDVNLAEWLRQLSQDSSPAVRAAAIRAVDENPTVDLSQRLREMAQHDPSEAIRLNARVYLRQRLAMQAMRDR